MNITKKDVYISSSVNSLGKCISWRSFLACGMNRSMVLINQTAESSKIVAQFTKHSDIVTAVSWVDDDVVVSADNGGTIIIWRVSIDVELLNHSVYKVEQFASGVTDVRGVVVGSHLYVVCCSEDRWALLKVSKETLEVVLVKSQSYAPHYVHCVNVITFGSFLLISCGISDCRVICQSYDIAEDILSSSVTLVGHEDAVMSLDSINSNGKVLIASASLDCYIRVWEVNDWSQSEININMDSHKIVCGQNFKINIALGAILVGHENWVTSVNFCLNEKNIVIVSTSMDKSVIVWRETKGDEYSNWIEEARLGQVGGNGLGFIGGSIMATGNMIASIGYQGTMIVWKKDYETTSWNSVINVSGHFDVVEDLSWEKEQGRYLISVSKDQTTRIHAPCFKLNGNEWHEIGRPQVHGYDLTCVNSLNFTTFISGADEKISRVFKMNKSFYNFLIELIPDNFGVCELSDDIVAVDALGLSNKVISKEETTSDYSLIPKEDTVAGRTLWPEETKLYGHVYEIFRISSHPERKIVATSCKASVQEYADIIIWDTDSWTIIQRLVFHKSTVLRVQFSKNGDKMLSVSKDRQWALWKLSSNNYELSAHSSKINNHSKIIWDADWSADDAYFVTVSRDKKVILWNGDDGSLIGSPLLMKHSVNTVSAWPVIVEQSPIFAIGLENGDIKVISFNLRIQCWTEMLSFTAHHDWITRLSFHPIVTDDKCLLASCSKDRYVKVFEISIK